MTYIVPIRQRLDNYIARGGQPLMDEYEPIDALLDENERLREALTVLHDDAADLCAATASVGELPLSGEDVDAVVAARVHTERSCTNALAALNYAEPEHERMRLQVVATWALPVAPTIPNPTEP